MAALRRLGAALALGAVGCALWPGREDDGLAFSHRIHVVGEELDCAMCHEDIAFADEPGMPPPDACALCHESLDAEKPEGERVLDLFQDDAFPAARVSALDDEVVFSHLAHVEAELDCAQCHAGIREADGIGRDLAVPMARCVDCHAETERPTDCATCHRTVGTDWAPESHALDWEHAHGPLARHGMGRFDLPPAQDCSLCHDEATCAECHAIEPPRSHTAGFRLKGHGLLARMDRASCATCHEPASCERCHQETEPLSHGGMWGGTKALHCLGCHTPLESNGCATCHHATPSHALAPPKPDWHDAAMNCTGCHGRGVPLPHVDNGENCNLCHF